jgi:hypothetical protein
MPKSSQTLHGSIRNRMLKSLKRCRRLQVVLLQVVLLQAEAEEELLPLQVPLQLKAEAVR